MITSVKNYTQKKPKNRQNPRTNCKSKAIQTKITESIRIHTHKKRKRKKIYIYIKKEESNQSMNRSTHDNEL